LSVSLLWNAALVANTDLTSPIFSVVSLTAGRHGQQQNTIDIEMNFNEVVQGNMDNIKIVAN
jgi:hypothetical protein